MEIQPQTHHLTLPLTHKKQLEPIQLGDIVVLNGVLVTGRDLVHKYFVEKKDQDKELLEKIKPILRYGAIYHCGPIIDLSTRQVISAGPTTSIREEPYQADVISFFDLACVIGKGGMGKKTLQALQNYHALYLHAVGGAGSFYAQKMKVLDVFKLEEFGMPEALWVVEVKDFPTIVTMDFRNQSIHQRVEEKSKKNLYLV